MHSGIWQLRILLMAVLIATFDVHADPIDIATNEIGTHFDSSSMTPFDEGAAEIGNAIPHVSAGLDGLSPATATTRLSAIASAPEARTRGAKEAKLYQELSPRVVMVVTDSAIGSGALIGNSSTVVTNWHVIEGYSTVGVIYKPPREGDKLGPADVRRATVVRIDEISDLALLRVDEAPKGHATFELGNVDEIPVGSDVHAIGHPTGESWTYTKGFVSQIRRDYEWATESGKVHNADVIQTQTPINPGNSGGPLISDSYRLVGVNSFKSSGEALNFAVSVDEIRTFLSRKENRYARTARSKTSPPSDECELRAVGSERSPDGSAMRYYFDYDCDGNADGFRTEPFDKSQPILVSIDSTGNGEIDAVYIDEDRDGQVDVSVYDSNGDGKPDLLGYHRNGEVEPYRLEPMRG